MDLIDAYNINTKGKLLIVSVDHKQDTLILKPPAICKSNFCAFFRDKAPGDHPRKCILLYLMLFAAGGVFRVYIIEMSKKMHFGGRSPTGHFLSVRFHIRANLIVPYSLNLNSQTLTLDTLYDIFVLQYSVVIHLVVSQSFSVFMWILFCQLQHCILLHPQNTLSILFLTCLSTFFLFTIYTWPMTFVLSLCVFPFHLMLESKTLIWFCYFYI